jgi:hypothetical protein
MRDFERVRGCGCGRSAPLKPRTLGCTSIIAEAAAWYGSPDPDPVCAAPRQAASGFSSRVRIPPSQLAEQMNEADMELFSKVVDGES